MIYKCDCGFIGYTTKERKDHRAYCPRDWHVKYTAPRKRKMKTRARAKYELLKNTPDPMIIGLAKKYGEYK